MTTELNTKAENQKARSGKLSSSVIVHAKWYWLLVFALMGAVTAKLFTRAPFHGYWPSFDISLQWWVVVMSLLLAFVLPWQGRDFSPLRLRHLVAQSKIRVLAATVGVAAAYLAAGLIAAICVWFLQINPAEAGGHPSWGMACAALAWLASAIAIGILFTILSSGILSSLAAVLTVLIGIAASWFATSNVSAPFFGPLPDGGVIAS